MSDLLTLEDYQAIAERLEFPTQCYIGGEFRDAISGETFESINPATGEVLANIASQRKTRNRTLRVGHFDQLKRPIECR